VAVYGVGNENRGRKQRERLQIVAQRTLEPSRDADQRHHGSRDDAVHL
jgi:hypothetical protein